MNIAMPSADPTKLLAAKKSLTSSRPKDAARSASRSKSATRKSATRAEPEDDDVEEDAVGSEGATQRPGTLRKAGREASASGPAEATGSKSKGNTLKKKRKTKSGHGIEGGGSANAEEEEGEEEDDDQGSVDEAIERDDEPFELGANKWAVRFYTSTTPSKTTVLIDDEGRGPRIKEILVTKAHSCRFLSKGNWDLRLYAFEAAVPHDDDETAPPLIVSTSKNQASTEGWKAYEVVRSTAPQRAPVREKLELDEDEKAELLDLVKEFKKLDKNKMTQLDLGDEECVAELKKAVKAGLLGAGELKAQVDKFNKANGEEDGPPVASTSGARHDDADRASVKSKRLSTRKDDDVSSVKSKKSSKKDDEDEPAPEGKGNGKPKRASR